MSLSTYYLEFGRNGARRRRRFRAYAPTSNSASHDNNEKINSWVSFSFLYEYGAPLGGPSGCRRSAININRSISRCFPNIALRIPTAHDFRVISACVSAYQRVRAQIAGDFPQTKLDSEINAPFLLNEHGDPHFFIS